MIKVLWAAVGVTMMASVFAATESSSDYTGLALVITAIGTVLTAVISAVAAAKATAAAATASRAENQAITTHQAVNSRMDEFKRLFEDTFKMKGAQEQRDKTAATAAAVAAAQPPVARPESLLLAAEVKAQALIAEATRSAAALLAEAHKVSISNPASNPVPVQVVGPGVDTPLVVQETGDKKGPANAK